MTRAPVTDLATRLLLSLAVIGVVGTALGGGTLATFSAQTDNAATFVGGTVTMTNVAGSVVSGSNCATATTAGTCAVIFSATGLKPGAADRTNTVTITYTGSLATSDFRLYASGYQSKGASSAAVCTATDPASKLNMQVKQGATIVYPTTGTGYGTLAGFATTYASSAAGLPLKGSGGTGGVWTTNDAATFTLAVDLDATVDNTYQGCQSGVTLVWYAVQ